MNPELPEAVRHGAARGQYPRKKRQLAFLILVHAGELANKFTNSRPAVSLRMHTAFAALQEAQRRLAHFSD